MMDREGRSLFGSAAAVVEEEEKKTKMREREGERASVGV